jgi:hypothetical protein
MRVRLRVLALALCLFAVGRVATHAQPIPPPGNSPSPASELWGALAFTADGSWATAWKMPSKAEAEAKVAVECANFGRGRCKVVSFSGNTCVALATARARRSVASYSAGGPTVGEAQQAAVDHCHEAGRRRCQLRTVVCADGR